MVRRVIVVLIFCAHMVAAFSHSFGSGWGRGLLNFMEVVTNQLILSKFSYSKLNLVILSPLLYLSFAAPSHLNAAIQLVRCDTALWTGPSESSNIVLSPSFLWRPTTLSFVSVSNLLFSGVQAC